MRNKNSLCNAPSTVLGTQQVHNTVIISQHLLIASPLSKDSTRAFSFYLYNNPMRWVVLLILLFPDG